MVPVRIWLGQQKIIFMSKDWMIKPGEKKPRNIEEFFADMDSKFEKAMELANKIDGPPDSSFWKYFRIGKKKK